MTILDAHRVNSRTGSASFSLANRIYRAVWGVTWLLMARWTPPQFRTWRRFLLRLFGARMGVGSDVRPTASVWSPRNLRMGAYATIGHGVHCYTMAPISIGDYAVISQRAHLCAGTHDVDSFDMQLRAYPIEIGSHAWICAEAFVGPGVRIGQGAVLGARGVATKDMDQWTIYAGNPARRLRSRTPFVAGQSHADPV